MAEKQDGNEKAYKFYREHFGPLVLKPLHYDLTFDMKPEKVKVVARQTYLYAGDVPTTELELNAHDLDVQSVHRYEQHSALGPPPVGIDAAVPDFVAHIASLASPVPTEFQVKGDERKVIVRLAQPLEPGSEIAIRTVSECTPTANILEGIYYDYTPEGAPQTMITQCQQYGFQRIVPCVDRMASKTFYTTTIIADARYTNLVTNGDVAPEFIAAGEGKDGEPTAKPAPIDTDSAAVVLGAEVSALIDVAAADPRVVIRYYNHKVNMAPYLFFLGVGTYETYRKRVEYPDGDSFMLELLCLPGVSSADDAQTSLKALHDSIMWVYLCSGPEALDHTEEREQIYQLLAERASLDAAGEAGAPRRAEVAQQLAKLMSVWVETGYKYTGSVYREIAMENSNYGGMENVGNTTIISSRLTPSPWLLDGGYIYMEGVKVHEYYHNINGSQVTGASPFEIWLNEAVTVHVQRQRESVLFGKDYMRLRQVIYGFMPGTGPLAVDRSPTSMAVEPRGFNTTHELISAMTYSKAPEFVRMCQRILGDRKFLRALENYHQKYAFSNATTADWIAEMAALAPEDVSLVEMARGWLSRTGYPTVNVDSVDAADGGGISIQLRQTGFEQHAEAERYPWIVPISWSVNRGAEVLRSGLFVMKEATGSIVVEDLPSEDVLGDETVYVSVGRDWSFFGDVVCSDTYMNPTRVGVQALQDPDAVNRYLAYARLVDARKAALIEGRETTTEEWDEFLRVYGAILTQESLSPATRALFLNLREAIPSRPDLGHRYQDIYEANRSILRKVWEAHGEKVLQLYRESIAGVKARKGAAQIDGLMDRPLLYVLVSILREGLYDSPDASSTALPSGMDLIGDMRELLLSTNMSNRTFALRTLLEMEAVPAELRESVMSEARSEWTQHPTGCEQYIQCVAGADCRRTPQYVSQLLDEPFFNMALAGHARTVARCWTGNPKISLMTDEGLEYTVALFLKIGKVNQMSAYSFLSAFGDLRKFDEAQQQRLEGALRRMQEGLDAKKQMSLANQLAILLGKASK